MELFGARIADMVASREYVQMPAGSGRDLVDYMATSYGPLVRARMLLEARGEWEALRLELTDIACSHDAAEGRGFAGRAEYLTAVLECAVTERSPAGPRP